MTLARGESYMSQGLLWWGYIHQNGSIQVKRYFDREDISEALLSPFVDRVYDPFYANDRANAISIIETKEKGSE